MNIVDAIQLKYPLVDFLKDVILQDDGQGVFIREWNLADPEPTQSDIDAWAVEFDLEYRQKQAVLLRKYPSVQDQLDMLYHDKIDSTTVWQDTITAIKLAHPKPTK